MANLLKVGALFKSYKDFETALNDYCTEKSVLFRKVSSISVQKANAALSPADTAYDERLVYKNLTLRCKSGNLVRESQSKGIRPNQWTLNIQCAGQISLCAQTVPQALRVSKLVDIHNHATTKDFAKFYPENRRLKKDADIAQVKGMVLCRGQPIDIRDHVRTNLSVCMTTKDLANFRRELMSSQRKASNGEEDVIKEMNSLLETDPGAVVGIVTAEPTASSADADSTQVAPLLNILFFQTSSMRDLFLKFGEILGIDTTYNTNRHNMHLIVFVVYDNHKNGRVVAFCFVRRERRKL
ncbi:hypothetical protein ONE63_000030 [Megalurothrips usitatus]|uniref:Uncharacterized protein n=1 Tax=Megalurothrips usitatus TaxID=439358 RepID=A0AAV7Y4D6_9NEOP|nr:hypothetical protein ONE63_000030 [Megalurothrips usitatus]